jgi:hypothetical protein
MLFGATAGLAVPFRCLQPAAGILDYRILFILVVLFGREMGVATPECFSSTSDIEGPIRD